MQREISVLLRSVFSVTIVCTVLGAASLSGPDPAGSLPNGIAWEPGPILVGSISTIMTPSCSVTRNPLSVSVTAERRYEAASHSCAIAAPSTHDSSEPARKPPGVVALAFLNPAGPPPILDVLSTY